MSKGITGKVYEIKVLPNTATQLLEAVYNQKDLSRAEARAMAQYLDDKYNMGEYIPFMSKAVKVHKIT